jgi:hypothetical protein
MGGRLPRRGSCMGCRLPSSAWSFCWLAHALSMHPLPVTSAAWVIRLRGPGRHVVVHIAETLSDCRSVAMICMGAQGPAIGKTPNRGGVATLWGGAPTPWSATTGSCTPAGHPLSGAGLGGKRVSGLSCDLLTGISQDDRVSRLVVSAPVAAGSSGRGMLDIPRGLGSTRKRRCDVASPSRGRMASHTDAPGRHPCLGSNGCRFGGPTDLAGATRCSGNDRTGDPRAFVLRLGPIWGTNSDSSQCP